MTTLTSEKVTLYKSQKVCHICKGGFFYDENKKSEFKLFQKVRDHCHYTRKFRGAAHSNCNLQYKVPKKIPIVFHNGSTYDYYFIIKQLAENFKGQYECLGENREKYTTFAVQIKQDDNSKKITYKLKFIHSYRFMNSKLSDLVDNLSDINKKECLECMRKKIKSECEFIGFKDDRLHYRCKKCKKRCTKSKNGLIKKFPRIYKFCNGDLNKFALLIRKGVYPYERFDETLLPDKKAFHSKLKLEDITDEDYEHYQKVWEVFGIKNLGKYHDLYVQSNTLLYTDVFENFRERLIEIY